MDLETAMKKPRRTFWVYVGGGADLYADGPDHHIRVERPPIGWRKVTLKEETMPKRKIARSARSGKFVTKAAARKRPAETVTETIAKDDRPRARSAGSITTIVVCIGPPYCHDEQAMVERRAAPCDRCVKHRVDLRRRSDFTAAIQRKWKAARAEAAAKK